KKLSTIDSKEVARSRRTLWTRGALHTSRTRRARWPLWSRRPVRACRSLWTLRPLKPNWPLGPRLVPGELGLVARLAGCCGAVDHSQVSVGIVETAVDHTICIGDRRADKNHYQREPTESGDQTSQV